jgi:HKD family nuclease
VRPYVQTQRQQSTLEHWKGILEGNELRSFAAFAYVTDSGVAQLSTHLSPVLGASRECRWLFGIDYGRSHPVALRRLAAFGDSTIRIHDGAHVVQSIAFVPRVSFHLKTALTLQKTGHPCKQIVGSGNLSASGLLAGIEAGCVVDYATVDDAYADALMTELERLWEVSTPLDDVIDDYESLYERLIQPRVLESKPRILSECAELFWIDVGYVTKNRGPNKPGNQFDLPKGAHALLGLKEVTNPALNSVLGNLNVRTRSGRVVERTLRYGNNSMEKLTLPIPEENGYECYDGKILTFHSKDGQVLLEALEPDDFFQIHGKRISSCREMQSGRRYGTVFVPR